MVWVYKIDIDGVTRYIGQTNNLKRRETQHNYLCFKADKKKDLYDKVRESNTERIELTPIKSFKNKTEAKRYEALLVLTDHFTQKNLYQQVPRLSDRF